MDASTRKPTPEWYDLSYYKGMYNRLTYNEIYWELVARKRLYDLYDNKKKSLTSNPFKEVWELITSQNDARSALDFFTFEPIEEAENLTQTSKSTKCYDIDLSRNLPYSSAIQPLPINTVITLYDQIKKEINCNESINPYDGILQIDNGRYLLADIDAMDFSESDSKLHLQIDLTVPNNEIIRQLKVLLPDLRERKNIEAGKFTFIQGDEKKIISHQVIPYLDLSFWSTHSSCELTAKDMSELLFPKWLERDEKFIRETLKPFALKCISDEFLARWKFNIKNTNKKMST
jgi:hypothetical protein